MVHGPDELEAGVAALYEAARKNEESAPRKHHLVPASYLARWATDNRLRMDLQPSIADVSYVVDMATCDPWLVASSPDAWAVAP